MYFFVVDFFVEMVFGEVFGYMYCGSGVEICGDECVFQFFDCFIVQFVFGEDCSDGFVQFG